MKTAYGTRIIQQKEVKYKGKPLLISEAEFIGPNTFEVLAMRLDGDTIDSYENLKLQEDADYYFKKLCKKYSQTEKKPVKKEDTKIPERYIKFAKAYNEVYHKCKAYFSENPVNDGNASNLDCCLVSIGKRVQKGFLNAALKPYGLKANLHKGNIISVVVPFTNYQGDGNTLQAKFMCQCFADLGYETQMYYQID